MKRISINHIMKRKGADPLVMVTCYDATFARLVERGGADLILVGDSLGMVIQGHEHTLPVTLDEVIYHARAVARGCDRPHLVGDMPFGTYQISPEEALKNATRLMQEGRVQSVKLEGGVAVAPSVSRIVEAGIPVMGHLGLTPQSVHQLGGYRIQGRSDEAAEKLLCDAHALEQAGAFAVVLEGIPAPLADRVTQALSIPTIGIGAGPACDGQVLVLYDLLGIYPQKSPKFSKNFLDGAGSVSGAVQAFIEEVRSGQFPGSEHSF